MLSACVLPLTSFSATEINDTSSLPFLNPDLQKRQIVKIKLENQLEVLLISDPDADLSSAAMAVRSGSWDDPAEYPGMAHFCEHMLFMGSEKFPDENAFMSLLSNYGGSSNAFTAEDRTVYMFSSRKEGFLSLLDHFAHFYIDPLFNTSSIARELHAVDQEFAKNIEHDGWRIRMIWKEMGNPEHPNRMFSIGNSETLSHIPQSALVKWHQEQYGANRMHLAIYSSLSVEELKQSVEEYFSAIPVVHTEPSKKEMPLLSARQKGHITYVTPFQKIQAAFLRWELPLELSQDPTQSAQLLAFALARAQKNNLEEFLKTEKLIDHISISAETDGDEQHRFFQIQLYLTQKGLDQLDSTLLRCFQALSGLKNEGIPSYLFEERNSLSKLLYQYQNRKDAFSYIQSVGASLPDEPLESYPRAQMIGSEYNPKKIEEVFNQLTPQACAITVIAPPELTKLTTDRKERWMGAEYAIRPISPDAISLWASAEPHPSIRIAKPNPFVPSHLASFPAADEASHPALIAENDFGTAYYTRVPEFSSPEISHTLHIMTPSIRSDAKSQVLATLFIDHITDQINPILATAASAGLNSRFSLDKCQLTIQVYGFSEKAPLLLEEILRNLTMHPPTEEQFDLYFARHEKNFSNSQKELAFRQAKEIIDSLIYKSRHTSKERLAALQSITYSEFAQFCKNLFNEVYIKALFAGNLSEKQALSNWVDALHALGKSPYLKNRHIPTQSFSLNPDKGPYRISQTTEVQGSASLLFIDEGAFTFQKRGAQEVLSAAIKESFFNELRTKQKTGYIAASDAQEIEGRLYQYFIVQSNTHQPEDLLYRFELFLETYLQNISEEIGLERFKILRDSAIDSLKTRFRNLQNKAALWDLLAFEQNGDFRFIEKRIKALRNLKYDEFVSIAKSFLSRENRKRLALLIEGKSAQPFAYESLELNEVDEIANWEPRFYADETEELVSAEALLHEEPN